MKEPILHKAKIKPILDKNYDIVCDADDYDKINQLIREKTINEINALYVPKQIYTLSIDLLDLSEYEFSYTDSYVDYNKLISCLQKKLSTNQNIILIGSTRGWYSYLSHHVSITAMTNTPVIDSDRLAGYLKIYVCIGKESIEPWLTDEQLKLLNSRKEHLKALKIFEAMYLPAIKEAAKKISPNASVLYEYDTYNTYNLKLSRETLNNIISTYLKQQLGDLTSAGIEFKLYHESYNGVDVIFDIKKFKENIINNENVEA